MKKIIIIVLLFIIVIASFGVLISTEGKIGVIKVISFLLVVFSLIVDYARTLRNND